MIGARRIPRRGPYPGVFLGDQLSVGQRLLRGVTPELPAHTFVHALGEGLGQPVRQRLHQDAPVVVAGGLEPGGELGYALSGGDHERSGMVGHARRGRRHEIRQAQIRTPGPLGELLAQTREDRERGRPGLVGVEDYVVARGIGRV